MNDQNLKILLVGLVFGLVHVLSPYVASYRERVDPHFSSLCGGFAASFVFLELLPSIDDYHEVIGKRIYGFILIGFAAFYGLECYLERKRKTWISANKEYYIGMFLAFLYSLTLTIGMANELPSSVVLTMSFSILIGFHLLSTDLGLVEQNPKMYAESGRFVLVAAIIAGLTISFLGDPDERVADIVSAAVAGVVLYRVMRHELPEFRQAHYRSFVAGATFFAVLHIFLNTD